jgi:acetyl-CoA carboxylase biotin carboxyl carrier protein
MEMDQQLMLALLDAFDKSDWQEMTVTIGSDRLHMSRREDANGDIGAAGAPPPPAPAHEAVAASPAAPAPPAAPVQPSGSEQGHAEQMHGSATPPTGTVIESPSVGLFWRAPSPSAPPFVEVGARVAVGDTLAIVEVMKLMSHVVAPVAGVVKAILAENGTTVEYGQPIVVIDPEA